jgi:hypothetical protein
MKPWMLIQGFVAPLRRLERRFLPPEGNALSTELQGRNDPIVTEGFEAFKPSKRRVQRFHILRGRTNLTFSTG